MKMYGHSTNRLYALKTVALFLLVIIYAFALAGCNTSVETDPNISGTDVIFNWGEPGYINAAVFATDNEYPGYELSLADCPDIEGVLGDISLYDTVILDAVLYDRAGDLFPEGTSPMDTQAQFHILLDGSSGWGDENKLLTQDNMKISGETSSAVPSSATGKPGKILVQAHYVSGATIQVGYIEIRKLVFKANTGNVVLDVIFDNGNYMEVAGNKITFKNAMYSDCAAQYAFPAGFFPLHGKMLVFNFRLEDHDEALEHQIHIQAAHADAAKDKFNGRDTPPGQKYITLDDPDGDYDPATGTGSFTVSCDDLIAASQVSGDAPDIKGPFELNAVRIVNNGTFWNGDGKDHDREKSYSIIFQSITVH